MLSTPKNKKAFRFSSWFGAKRQFIRRFDEIIPSISFIREYRRAPSTMPVHFLPFQTSELPRKRSPSNRTPLTPRSLNVTTGVPRGTYSLRHVARRSEFEFVSGNGTLRKPLMHITPKMKKKAKLAISADYSTISVVSYCAIVPVTILVDGMPITARASFVHILSATNCK